LKSILFCLYLGTGELERNPDTYKDPLGLGSFWISLFLFGVVGFDYF